MKYVLLILAVLGMVVAALALREHYREYGDSPCSINEHWDCGVVNHSKYALVGGAVPALNAVPVLGALPVATAGILGYLVMAGLACSLYLATIEKNVLGVWCIYCVNSLGIICVMCIVNLGAAIAGAMRKPRAA
jgi:vitamin-K-epoxide reductase (warfarin-sensitive)